jgi:hypothetical protein
MNQADKESLWNAVHPSLAKAWAAYEQLHGIPATTWPDQERALFDLAPRLYRDYHLGLTPAMEHGAARSELRDQVGAYCKAWGAAVTARDLGDYLGVQRSTPSRAQRGPQKDEKE